MLQIEKSPPIVERGPPSSEFVSSAELLASFIGFFRRQYSVVLFGLLLSLGIGAVYLFTTPPRYTGLAKLIIDTHKIQLFQQQSVLGDIPVDSATVESQVEILKSENIALSVIKDLHLTEDPEFVNPRAGLIGTVIGFIPSLFSSSEPASEFELTRRALGTFQSRLGVKRVGLTYVIDISFASLNPDRAAEIANAVADAYVVDQLEAKYQTTKRAGAWLQDRLKELREQAAAAERAVVDYKARNNIVDTGGRLMNEQQLAELNSALIQAQAQTAEAQARLERVSQILRTGNPDPAQVDTATVADTLHNDVITKLRQQYLDLAARESDWARRYGNNHLAVINLRNQMASIRANVTDELKRIAETYKSDYQIAKTREDSIQVSLNQIVAQSQTTNEAQITLHGLDSSAQTYRALYDNFLQRYMESVQQESFPITEARLITKASRPLNKSSPKSLLVLAVAAFGGAMLGLGLGMLRDIADRVFRTSGQVEAELQADCIALVPLVKGSANGDAAAQSCGAEVPAAERSIISDHGVLWHVIDSPFSRFTESVRSIKVAADVAGIAKAGKVIGVTSSLPNEGKSTIATSLAQLTAHGGARAVLIDCDLRNPSLSRKLAPRAGVGLIEVVAGRASPEEAIWTDHTTRLSFLPVVVKSRLIHTNEILASEGMKRLFDFLRERFDYIVVDLSPLAPVVDVRATTGLIDSYLFVVEWGRTKIDVAQHALDVARGVQDNMLGVVLNKADVNRLSRYESYRGKYYYNRYYARYGYTD